MQALSIPVRSFTLPSQAMTIVGMAHTRPIHTIRWRNFRRLIGPGKGGVTEAAGRLGKSQGQVSHFGGERPSKIIGDQIAGEIEAAWSLPPGWLDLNDSTLPTTGTLPDLHVPETLDPAAVIAEAEKWLRIEERLHGEFQPLRRAKRLLELCQLVISDGGELSTEHGAAIYRTPGEERHGSKAKGGNRH